MYREHSLAGKLALVTGASSGIGEATARYLAAEGANVVLVARREERLAEVSKLIATRSPSVKCTTVVADVCDKDILKKLDDAGASAPDIFINNAGLARGRDSVESAKVDDWLEMLNTNITAAFLITRHCLPKMIARGGGHIVFTGSIAGHLTYPGGSVYCASKHAVTAFAKVLREETCDKNIRVSVISPGMVETEFSEVRLRDSLAAKKVYEGMDPLIGLDIAHQIIFCLKQPPHVNIDEILVTPIAQGSPTRVHRS